MNKIIVFDFMRTLYDPDGECLTPGALEVLQATHAKGYRLILLSKTGDGRSQQIEGLGIAHFFDRIELVDEKSAAMMQAFLDEFDALAADSFVLGDRAQKELTVGHAVGMQTIWYHCGKFADEMPEGFTATHEIKDLRHAVACFA